MHISAEGSGGFSGQAVHYAVDTATALNGRALEALVRDIDFFERQPPSQVGADLMRWTITVDDGGRHHSVSFAEDGSAAAAPWQSLLAQLRAAA